MRIAGQFGLLFHNSIWKEKLGVLAIEKEINNHSLLKLRIGLDGDTDLAVKAKLSEDMDVTFCAGLHLDEHSQRITARKIEEYAEDVDAEPKLLALQQSLSNGQSLRDFWVSPYFGINFALKL